jgi:YcxB-like protein
MTLYFSYDKKQVLQALRYHFITRREIKILLIAVNVFAIVSAALFFFHKISGLAFFIGSFLWMSLMVVFWHLLPGAIYKRAATFRDAFTIIFNDTDMRIVNEQGGYKEWDWKQFSSFMESPNFFHLYLNSRSFFLVPKEACKGRDGVQELRQILKEKIKR